MCDDPSLCHSGEARTLHGLRTGACVCIVQWVAKSIVCLSFALSTWCSGEHWVEAGCMGYAWSWCSLGSCHTIASTGYTSWVSIEVLLFYFAFSNQQPTWFCRIFATDQRPVQLGNRVVVSSLDHSCSAASSQ